MKKILLLFVVALLMISGCKTEEEPVKPVIPVEKEPVLKATCSDGIKNQGEEDIDCGGPCKVCPGCEDGIMNLGEEGIDCGGPCGPCPSCDDGIKNQDEEDIDCGGSCEPCPVPGYELTSQQIAGLEEKVKMNIRAEFLVPSYPAGIEIGDPHVFALGIRNVFLETYEFRVDITYVRARDMSNNPMDGLDEATVLGWFDQNEFEPYELDKYELIPLPVGVTVGEVVAPGIPTAPGNYYFKAKVTYKERENLIEDYTEQEFNFRVK